MKTITVVVPTYNEEENVELVYERVQNVFSSQLSQYQLELLFIDNDSKDATRSKILSLCQRDARVKAIFNARNFGFNRSTFYGLSQAEGDCAVLMFADMQDPPEVIPQMVKAWEEGYRIVIGIKSKSQESKWMYAIRGLYYKVVKWISEIDHIQQFDGFGLYDRAFISVLRNLNDPMPYLRGIVAELGFERAEIDYEQAVREHGKSHFNFMKMYDLAMLGITSYSKAMMRMATFVGFGISMFSFVIALWTFIRKLLFWDTYAIGSAATLIGVYFFGGALLLFAGILGEYIANINTRVMGHPLVVEKCRVNFGKRAASNEEQNPVDQEQ